MPTSTRAPYLRATVSGRHRYADLVLPTDEPVALLVPQLLELLDEPQELGQVHVTTSLGHVLDPSRPLADSGLVDGVRLHLVTAHDLPPAPLVHDLVEIVEDSEAPGRWTQRNRATTLAVLGGLVAGAAVLLAFAVLPGFQGGPALAVACGALAVSVLCAVPGVSAHAWVAAALGVGTATLTLQRAEVPGLAAALLLVGLVALSVAAAAWCGHQLVAGATTVVTLAVLTSVGVATWLVTDDVVRTAAVVSTVTVLAVGLAPRVALGSSGVFALDSRLAEGGEVARVNAEDAVARAHWGLTGATLVTAGVFAVAAFALGRDGAMEPWPAGLTVVVSLAFGLRARHFPLALHRGALWAAALGGPLGLVVAGERRWPEYGPWLVAGVAAVGVLVAVAGVVRRTALLQARSRRRANQLETTAILLSVPAVLGVFGVYQDLLRTFQ